MQEGIQVKLLPARLFTEYQKKGYNAVKHWIAKVQHTYL